jgi:hypothetical protein
MPEMENEDEPMTEEYERSLSEAFRLAERDFDDEPFVTDVGNRLRRLRRARTSAPVIAFVIVLAALALASPWLVAASGALSAELGGLFAEANGFLMTPAGTVAAIVSSIVLVVLNRKHVL